MIIVSLRDDRAVALERQTVSLTRRNGHHAAQPGRHRPLAITVKGIDGRGSPLQSPDRSDSVQQRPSGSIGPERSGGKRISTRPASR